MDFSRSIKTVSKTDFYIQARNDSRKTWKVNMKKRSSRNYFSDFLYAARLFRRINAKVIQAEVLIYLSFWFDLYIIKILLVQDMKSRQWNQKCRWSWHWTILFCVWYLLMVEEGTLIAVWSILKSYRPKVLHRALFLWVLSSFKILIVHILYSHCSLIS